MKNTKENRMKFLKKHLKMLLSFKEKKYLREKLLKAVDELNNTLSKKRKIILIDNPTEFWYFIKSQLIKKNKKDFFIELKDELGSELRDELGSEIWSWFYNELNSEIGSKRRNKILDEFDNIIRNNLENEIWNEIWNGFKNIFGSKMANKYEDAFRYGYGFEYYEFLFPYFISKFFKNLKSVKENKAKIKALYKCFKAGIGYLLISKKKMFVLPFPKPTIDDVKYKKIIEEIIEKYKEKLILRGYEKVDIIFNIHINKEVIIQTEYVDVLKWLKKNKLTTKYKVLYEEIKKGIEVIVFFMFSFINGECVEAFKSSEKLSREARKQLKEIAHKIKIEKEQFEKKLFKELNKKINNLSNKNNFKIVKMIFDKFIELKENIIKKLLKFKNKI